MFQSFSKKNFSQLAAVSALALLYCLVSVPGAQASILPIGPPISASPDVFTTYVCPAPATCPVQLATTGLTAFTSTTGAVSGNYIASVYRDPLNAFGANNLDFVYQIFNSAASPDAVGRATAVNFTGFMVDAGYDPTGGTDFGAPYVNGGVTPQLVDRLSQDVIGFAFATPNPNLAIKPGQNSTTLIIQTNATNFTRGFLNIIDGGTTTVNAFQPLTAVPEPASFAMIGAGLLALAGIRRMRRS